MADNIEEDEDQDWLVTYADAITLLLAFFIMLVSFSKIDLPTYEQVAAGIRNEIGKHDVETPTESMKKDVQDVVYAMQASDLVSVETDEKGVVIELQSGAFFSPGTAEIRADAVPFLVSLAEALDVPRYHDYLLEAEGHTDDVPINTKAFPTNWELSTARASVLVRFLVSQDFDSERLKASGYAHTKPKAPNRDAEGNPIAENQAKNRRVLVRIYPLSLEERRKKLKAMALEKLNAEPEGTSPDETSTDDGANKEPADGAALPSLPPMQGTGESDKGLPPNPLQNLSR